MKNQIKNFKSNKNYKKKMNINIHLFDQTNAKLPTRGTSQSAGYDLYASEDIVLMPMERKLVSTGIGMSIPNGYYGKIFDRSGMAYKNGLTCLAGVIDSDYRGEVKVLLLNVTNSSKVVSKGERIAQIVFMEYLNTNFTTISKSDFLNDTFDNNRGNGGFGSTGTH